MTDDQSIVLKPRDYADIATYQNAGALEELLEQPLTFIVETINGALAAGSTGVVTAGGRIVQGLLKGMLFKQLNAELNAMRGKSRIPDDFADKPNAFQTWVELMTIIDQECQDQNRLDALKAKFPRLRSGHVGWSKYTKLCLIGSGELHLKLNRIL